MRRVGPSMPFRPKAKVATMIQRSQMFEPMLKACPSFQNGWTEFLADWKDEPGELPMYLALGDLARHLAALRISGQTDEFPAVFEVVERWHLEGDAYVREAATIGMLEGLQFAASHTELDETEFEPWLLPNSKKWWDKLTRFWGRDHTALRGE